MIVVGYLVSAACKLGDDPLQGSPPDPVAEIGAAVTEADALALTVPESRAVLRLVNQESMEFLRDQVGISAVTATRTTVTRAGADLIDGTRDDVAYASVDAFVAATGAAPDEVSRLLAYAQDNGFFHESILELFRVNTVVAVDRCTQIYSFTLFADRDTRLHLNAYNSANQPSQFQLTATGPSGLNLSTALSEYPSLFIPGQGVANRTVTITVKHQSKNLCWSAQFVIRRQPAPTQSELGACGPDVRDLFVRFAQRGEPWRGIEDYTASETLPDGVQLWNCSRNITCSVHQYHLAGSMMGPLGPILQIEDRDSNGRLADRSLAFFDRDGNLVRTVSGQLYFTLPDGNLLVSNGMSAEAPGTDPMAGVYESLQSVTPSGSVVWERQIGRAQPPTRVVTTASGNLVVSFLRLNDSRVAESDRAGLYTLNLATGSDVIDTFVDRSFMCDTSSTSTICLQSQARVLARFAAWWQSESVAHGTPTSNPAQVCSATSCTTVHLDGWYVEDDGSEILEVGMDKLGSTSSFSHSILAFRAEGLSTWGGKIYRRLGPDKLLISAALAGTGSVAPGDEPWYFTKENLQVLLVHRAGGMEVGGRPALAPPAFGDLSTGVMMPGNKFYWTATSARRDRGLVQKVIDLDTFAVTSPPLRQQEGLCPPRR
jgi:hypothetical protein